MPCSVPQSLDEVLTPSRKRKRAKEDLNLHLCHNGGGLSNEGFSSTPRKEVKCTSSAFAQAEHTNIGIAGINPFVSAGLCMEVKSIADIANEKSEADNNSYEVIRKPPKKKKKAHIEDVCFENQALNLDGPEKRFNPFEVKRESIKQPADNCFVNSALNIKSPENAAVNPYEITRSIDTSCEAYKEGIENLALDEPTSVAIALPFTPTIGCRIDFNGVSLDNLTPSKLLAEKLVFSPPPGFKGSAFKKSFRRSLSVISEEAVDIGKELDCYQLELENSINEAKLKKNPSDTNPVTEKSTILIENQNVNNKSSVSVNVTNINISINEKSPASQPTPPVIEILETIDETENNSDVSFDDEIDFKEPAPFVRCYRKSDLPRTHSEEIQQTNNTSKDSNKSNDEKQRRKHKFSNAIRKSIRKIMGSTNHHKKKDEENIVVDGEELNQQSETNHLLTTLRRSIRRKNNKNLIETDRNSMEDIEKREISIIDTTEKRRVYKFDGDNENEKVNMNEKLSFRKSFRKSTRDIRNQVMKKVFHRNVDEYKMKD